MEKNRLFKITVVLLKDIFYVRYFFKNDVYKDGNV